MSDRLVVYTIVVGWAFDLPPVTAFENVEYVCLTDQPLQDGNGWQIRQITPLLKDDPFRSSREPKTRPHLWFKDFNRSLYVDSSILLKCDPNRLWHALIPDEDVVFGAMHHSYRSSVADEFDAVLEAGLDYPFILEQQRRAYATHHADILEQKPIWGGILARRHTHPDCIAAMETWFVHILRYSRRDQLSLPLALASLSEQQKNILSRDNFETEFHKWINAIERKPPYYKVAVEKKERKIKILAKKIEGSLQRVWMKLRLMAKGTRGKEPPWSDEKGVGYDPSLGLFYKEDTYGKKVFVSDPQRLRLYEKGGEYRQTWLLKEYRLPNTLIRSGDVVIDIGANIGELGIWTNKCNGHYIAFEPDPKAFLALKNNVEGDLYDVALSDSNGIVEFFLNTAEADSSLFKPERVDQVIQVQTWRLDDFFEQIEKPEFVRLMKVEAEGMEPEVLYGAAQTLASVEYIAVDAGPERGLENTVPDVINMLTKAGFVIVDCFLLRGTFLLRNQAFVNESGKP